jgi:segregation and condensation protein B
MSLKAKLEAVIYAAEEPVTLAQLATLFADEALEWKAGQEAAAQEAEAERVLEEAVQAAPLLEGVALAEAAEAAVAEVEAQDVVATTEAETAPVEEQAEATPAVMVAEEGEDPSEAATPEADEAEARRLARLRDREVKAVLRAELDQLVADYASDSRGVEIREIAGGYRMATKPECHDAVRGFVKSLKPPLKLSLPALETLAVIAYKQPVTAPEVNEIRGVESSGVFGSLLARKLIATAGRKQVIGRPILYKTTKEFLLRFGLKDLSELPSMEEFEKMAASELEEPASAVDSMDEAAAEAVAATETVKEATAGEADVQAVPESASPAEELVERASEVTNAVEASEAEKETDNPAPEEAPAEPPPAP